MKISENVSIQQLIISFKSYYFLQSKRREHLDARDYSRCHE